MADHHYIEVYRFDRGEETLSVVYGPFPEDVADAELNGESAEMEAYDCSDMISVSKPDGYPSHIYVNPPEVWFAMSNWPHPDDTREMHP